MIKKYKSPELEIIKFTLSADVLTISEGENYKTSGVIIEPPDDEELLEE